MNLMMKNKTKITDFFSVINYIDILKQDMSMHKDVNSRLTKKEIKEIEIHQGLMLPESYKHFLSKFGDGAYSLYAVDQPINSINQTHQLGEYRKHLSANIETDGFGTFKRESLLCLMTENSNGGAWVWLTSENSEKGEWPLAFYNSEDKKLYYKVSGFTEWLKIATQCKSEVIRELDQSHRLGLG